MPTTREYEPYTIEVTKKFSLHENNARAVERFHENPFGDEDAILRTVMGPGPGVEMAARIRITWGKWGQFPQELSIPFRDQAGTPEPVWTEEVTRHYRVEPG